MDANTLQAIRLQAWAYGRDLCGDLMAEYRRQYGLSTPPPPARVAGELITDFLSATLRFDPLPQDRFGETRWEGGRAVVTVNSLTEHIPGVKDAEGVQNVAAMHELIHVVRDKNALQVGPNLPLPGFDPLRRIVCYRRVKANARDWHREFWAEEAGRAAAVSNLALRQSRAFQALSKLGGGSPTANAEAWRLLYETAKDIGVNSSALVKQLRLEGRIVVALEEGRNILYVQPTLADWLDAA